MKKNLPSWVWLIISLSCSIFIGFIDSITGDQLNFFVFYFAPIFISAWYVNFAASIFISFLSACIWLLADDISGQTSIIYFQALWNTTIRSISFVIIGLAVSKIRFLLDRERQLLSEIKVLEQFLPICSVCKKIRDKQGNWEQLELYISEHSDTKFSHGYCPECAQRAMSEVTRAGNKT